jgi:carbonic anhydrase/acetyltransferase-like protein (isoleucine patch superfamily)
MHGACLVAEGGSIEIGAGCIILENAVVRSTAKHAVVIGPCNLIGPNAHVVGCTTEESVFIATGAAVFHSAYLEAGSEVRINGVVHIKTRLPADATVPIGWIAVGDPAEILPPQEHEKIWSIQEPLDFPRTVYGIERQPDGRSMIPEICRRLADIYASHKEDKIL